MKRRVPSNGGSSAGPALGLQDGLVLGSRRLWSMVYLHGVVGQSDQVIDHDEEESMKIDGNWYPQWATI